MSYAIASASCSNFFGYVLGLVLSIRAAAAPEVPQIYILDVGLTRGQARALAGLTTAVIPANWDVPVPPGTASWRRAMISRPFLPRYVPAETIIWIDSDAWVQDWSVIPNLIAAAADGRIAIAEEVFGAGLTLGDGQRITGEALLPGLTQSLREGFGEAWAQRIGGMAPFNCGVFALRADSPVWGIWQAVMRAGMARALNFFVEQNALNVAIRGNQIAAHKLPIRYNFVCGHGLPDYDSARGLFVVPGTGEPIGILHLTDAKRVGRPAIRQIPSGDMAEMGLSYFDQLA